MEPCNAWAIYRLADKVSNDLIPLICPSNELKRCEILMQMNLKKLKAAAFDHIKSELDVDTAFRDLFKEELCYLFPELVSMAKIACLEVLHTEIDIDLL